MQTINVLSEEEFLSSRLILARGTTTMAGLKLGQPTLFWERGGIVQVFEQPTHFLLEKFVRSGRTSSPHSWAKAAYATKAWLEYSQVRGVYWLEAKHQDLIEYRDAWIETPNPRSGECYDEKGIGDAIYVIKNLYEHSREMGWYFSSIHKFNSIAGKSDPDIPKKSEGKGVAPLAPSDLLALTQAAGPRAAEKNGDFRNSRNRAIIDIGWVCGLRISEVANLKVSQFLNLDADTSAPLTNQKIKVLGKGKKYRDITIPTWLVLDVQKYIEEERAEAMRNCEGPSNANALFVGELGSSRCGKRIGVDAIQKIMKLTCLKAGLTLTSGEKASISKSVAMNVAKHSFHDLRHTYAVYTYHMERMLGNAEPWKKIQAQLGHKFLATTINIYLSKVELFENSPGLPSIEKLLGRDQ